MGSAYGFIKGSFMMKKILVTGAGGYIGSRLIVNLLLQGYEVIAVTRDKNRFATPSKLNGKIEVVEADLSEISHLERLPKDIDAAYYLVHSMSDIGEDFEEKEKVVASAFIDYLDRSSCQQVIYLTGLISDSTLSKHLRSRLAVEHILKEATCPHTILRAGIVIGSGSASFEIIRDLVEKLPLMVAPRWVKNKCQPISIVDVIFYLSACLGEERLYSKVLDIGGPDQLTYKEMLYQLASVRKLRRLIISIPVLTPKLSSLWLYFVTSANFSIARNLVDSLKNNAVCHDFTIREVIDHTCLNYEQALKRAFHKIEDDNVPSSWKDSFSSSQFSANWKELMRLPTHACFIEESETSLGELDIDGVFDQVLNIGGDHGYYCDWAWKIRGWIDKLVGGVGLNRGRARKQEITVGDAIDFWRVLILDRDNLRFALLAEMRVPGDAWLEFQINRAKRSLIVRATFRPRGVLGRLYWYILLPIHKVIFSGMGKKVIADAKKHL